MQQQKSYVFNNRFVLSIALNASFVFVELFYGFRANSVALIADAVHNAADVFGLTLIWFSYYMAKREAPHRFTYGYKTATILAAFINTIVIFVAVGNLVLVSITRFYHPQAVMSYTMIIVAAAAVVIHSLSAVMFLQGRHDDVNILGVFINMAMDAAVAFAVVIAGFFILWDGWLWLDPVMGLVIAAAILAGSWGLFKESINLIFQAVPSSVNLQEIKNAISNTKNIISYHDLHVWAMSTTENALSVHVVVSKESFDFDFVHELTDELKTKFKIHHSTIQIEIQSANEDCQANC